MNKVALDRRRSLRRRLAGKSPGLAVRLAAAQAPTCYGVTGGVLLSLVFLFKMMRDECVFNGFFPLFGLINE